MQTLVSLFLPAWSVELAGLRERRGKPRSRACAAAPEPPVLLSRVVSQRELVVARCGRARAAGVRTGMTVAEARALLPPGAEAVVREHAPARDAAALRRLAHWALRFTPLVAPDPPDGLLLDVTKSLRLFGGVEPIVEQFVRGVQRLGFSARGVAAPTFGAAWALARYASFRCEERAGTKRDRDEQCGLTQAAEPGLFASCSRVPELVIVNARAAVLRADREIDAAAILAPLPIAALRVEPETVAALEEIGVLTIGHVLDLPRPALPSRFGPLLVLRLQQALGLLSERIEPVQPIEPIRAEMAFDGPTTDAAAIECCVRELLGRCIAELRQRTLGARRIEIVLDRSDLDPLAMDITLSRPTDSPAHLWSLLRPKVENAHLGFGVEGIELRMPRLAKLRDAQPALPELAKAAPTALADGPVRRAAGELVDTLAARLGSARVSRVEVVQSHVPERVFRRRGVHEDDGARERGGLPDAPDELVTPSPRPTRLIEPVPVHAIALFPDGPIARLHLRGEELAIAACIGPERLGEEWWRLPERRPTPGARDQEVVPGTLHARDYFRVQDERGRWLWVFRHAPSGRWWLHGTWD